MPKLRRFLFLLFITALTITLGVLAWQAIPASSNTEIKWERVGDTAPPGLLKQLQQDYAPHLRPHIPVKITDTARMRMLKIQQPDSLPLYLINTRVSSPGHLEGTPTCGMGGCLFLGYIPDRTAPNQFKQVLNSLINDFQLPDAPPVIEPLDQTINGIPCFRLTSFNSIKKRMNSPVSLCFNGDKFVPAGQQNPNETIHLPSN